MRSPESQIVQCFSQVLKQLRIVAKLAEDRLSLQGRDKIMSDTKELINKTEDLIKVSEDARQVYMFDLRVRDEEVLDDAV